MKILFPLYNVLIIKNELLAKKKEICLFIN